MIKNMQELSSLRKKIFYSFRSQLSIFCYVEAFSIQVKDPRVGKQVGLKWNEKRWIRLQLKYLKVAMGLV